jgi:hypothetical protein
MGRPKKIVAETGLPALLAKFAVIQERVTVAQCSLSDSLAELEVIQAELLTRFNLDVREVGRGQREKEPDYGPLMNLAPVAEVEQVPTHSPAPIIVHQMGSNEVDRIREEAGMIGDPDKELQGDDLNKAASGVLNRLQRSLKP